MSRHSLDRRREALYRYWFADQPVADLAIVRIGVVAMLLIRLPSLEVAGTLGADGPRLAGNVLPVVRLAMVLLGRLGRWDVGHLAPVVWWTAVVAGTLALVGLFARVSVAIFAWALIVLYGAIYTRSGALYHNNAIAVIALGLIACGPCGAALSVDAAIRRHGKAPDTSPDVRWPLTTVQWLFAITYLSAAGSKLLTGGLGWFQPSTIQYYLVQDGMLFHVPLAQTVARYPAIAAASACFSIFYEGFFWTGLVWRRLLPVFVLGGMAMHIGIYVLQRANFAEYAPLALVFIDPLRQLGIEWRSARRSRENAS